ncbi:MAG TPA: hypothetical protein VFN31_02465 [Candidatus Saccharimonadales bacterium]|nr:hypothetical protein [Candidatus Saccharimonadales bacterium]
MLEKANQKNRTLRAATYGAFAVAGAIGLVSSLSSGGNKSRAATKPAPLEIKVGDTFKGVKFEEFNAQQESRRVTLTPDKNGILGIVYLPEVSQTLLGMTNDHNPDHAIGCLLTEKSDIVHLSYIIFLKHSGVIEDIIPEPAFKSTEQVLFSGGNTTLNEQFALKLDPTGKSDGAVILNYINEIQTTQTPPPPAIAA